MKTYESSTQICPIVSVGTYWGMYNFESLWQDYIDEDREEGYLVCDDYDFDAFKEELRKSVQSVFDKEKPLEPYGVRKFTAQKIGSPSEYNFMDDWLDFSVEVDDDWLDKSMETLSKPEHKDVIEQYFKDNWRSRDGFNSYMPHDLEELFENARQLRDDPDSWDADHEECRTVGAILLLLLLVDEKLEENKSSEWVEVPLPEDMSNLVYEDFTGCHTHSDFMTTVERDEVDKVFRKHYLKFDSVLDDISKDYRKYREAMAGNESALRKANHWFKKVKNEVDHYKWRQDYIIAGYFDRFAPKDEIGKLNKRDEIVEELHDLRKEFDKDREFEWQSFWKEE